MMLRWGLKPLEEIITLFTLFQKRNRGVARYEKRGCGEIFGKKDY